MDTDMESECYPKCKQNEVVLRWTYVSGDYKLIINDGDPLIDAPYGLLYITVIVEFELWNRNTWITSNRSKNDCGNWREKEVTKAAVKTFIYNYLYDDKTGLPDPFYSIDDVEQKTDIVFDHVFMQYQDSSHSVYV